MVSLPIEWYHQMVPRPELFCFFQNVAVTEAVPRVVLALVIQKVASVSVNRQHRRENVTSVWMDGST